MVCFDSEWQGAKPFGKLLQDYEVNIIALHKMHWIGQGVMKKRYGSVF
jgi:hypothetical protein